MCRRYVPRRRWGQIFMLGSHEFTPPTFQSEHVRGDGTLISLSGLPVDSPYPTQIIMNHYRLIHPSLNAPRDTIAYVVPHYFSTSLVSPDPDLTIAQAVDRVRDEIGIFRVYAVGNNAAMERTARNENLFGEEVSWHRERTHSGYCVALGGFMTATIGFKRDAVPGTSSNYVRPVPGPGTASIYVRPTVSTPSLVSEPMPQCSSCVNAPVLMCEACRAPYCSHECGKRDACRK